MKSNPTTIEIEEAPEPVLFDVGQPVPQPAPISIPDPPKIEIPDETEVMEFSPPVCGATFSLCRRYRFSLFRRFKSRGPVILIIGIKPSTVNENDNDPTVTRMEGFARREGAAMLLVANVFPWCGTDPKSLRQCTDFKQAENMSAILRMSERSGRIIAAWGNNGAYKNAGRALYGALRCGVSFECFGVTKLGHPKHVLYLRGDTKLQPFQYEQTEFETEES